MENFDLGPPSILSNTLLIDGSPFTYSINQLNNEERLSIKLELINDNNIYFLYETTTEKIIREIKILYLCENVEIMINKLEEVFKNKKVQVEKRDEKYYMKLEFQVDGDKKIYEVELQKHQPFNPLKDLNKKVNIIDNKYVELEKKYNELKKDYDELNEKYNCLIDETEKRKLIEEIENKLSIKERIKEIFNDEIKEKLFKEFEERIIKNIYTKNNILDLINKEKDNIIQSTNKNSEEKIKKSVILINNKLNERLNKEKEEIKNEYKENNKKLMNMKI